MLNQPSRINESDERYDTFGKDDNFAGRKKSSHPVKYLIEFHHSVVQLLLKGKSIIIVLL